MSQAQIFIVEDEPDLVEVLRYNLEREGFSVRAAGDAETGLEELKREPPSLLLLDLMLPGMDGLELCRRLKYSEETREIPIIMLTAKGEEGDVVAGLEVGADDYMSKPFGPRELVARVRSVLRRSERERSTEPSHRVEYDRLSIDADRHEIRVDGKEVELTATEFRLLDFLAQHPGRVYARSTLLRESVGEDVYVLDRNIDVHIRSIRKKLGALADMVQTVRGVGYRFRDELPA